MHHSASLELNKVDRLIKALMLSYPMLYKSRFDVLVQMFLFSTHSWLPDGTLDALQDVPTHDSMRYDDLEERQAQELGRQGQDTTGMVTTLNLSRLAALKREFATRRLIESDIDLYASHHVMGEHIQNGMEWLKRFSPAYCSLRTRHSIAWTRNLQPLLKRYWSLPETRFGEVLECTRSFTIPSLRILITSSSMKSFVACWRNWTR